MTVLNYLSLCSEWVLDAVSWWRRLCKLKLCLSWRSLAVEHPEGQLLTKSPHSPSTQSAFFLLCRQLSRKNIRDKWSALGGITCLQYGTLVGHAPLTLKGETAGAVVTPKLLLNGPGQRLVSLKHPFTGPTAGGLGITFACRFGWQHCSTNVSRLAQTSFTSWILQHLALSLVSPTL